MALKVARTPTQALIRAVHRVQPPVFADGVKVATSPSGLECVALTFHMTPELVKAWGEECADLSRE